MKQVKSETKEYVEKQGSKTNPEQNLAVAKKDDKPSWGVYFLLISMAIGMLLLLLKVLGVF
ncbi:MAG: hypothetical protein ACM34K_21200 [Bacillota bacterium]